MVYNILSIFFLFEIRVRKW